MSWQQCSLPTFLIPYPLLLLPSVHLGPLTSFWMVCLLRLTPMDLMTMDLYTLAGAKSHPLLLLREVCHWPEHLPITSSSLLHHQSLSLLLSQYLLHLFLSMFSSVGCSYPSHPLPGMLPGLLPDPCLQASLSKPFSYSNQRTLFRGQPDYGTLLTICQWITTDFRRPGCSTF